MKRLVAKLAALTLVTSAGVLTGPAAAEAHGSSHEHHSSLVEVQGFGNRVALSRNRIPQGRTTFKVAASTGSGSQITLFRLHHATLARFKADLANEFSTTPATAAKGTRGLKRHARFFGLADVVKGAPAKVTVKLSPGTYYLMDLAVAPGRNGPTLTTLKVRQSHGDDDHDDATMYGSHRGHVPTIKLRGHRFDSPKVLPANGTVRVKNAAHTIHFMAMEPVKEGTTDAEIQKFFDHPTGPPPFALSTPGVGLDVLSPGKQAELTYKVGAGTYVLLCFVSDEETGMPHAFMGMHKVVTLK